jgi:hypothetical protein
MEHIVDSGQDFGVPVAGLVEGDLTDHPVEWVDQRPNPAGPLVLTKAGTRSIEEATRQPAGTALGALKAEVKGSVHVISYGGANYVIPSIRDWDIEISEAAEQGAIAQATRALLGAEQWKAFRAKHGKMGDLIDLYGKIQSVMGAEPGE